jgi:hypothetical protein
MRKGRGMETTDESRLQKGSPFKSTLDGVPVIVEIDEVVMVDESKGEAVLRTHVVGTYETEVEEDEAGSGGGNLRRNAGGGENLMSQPVVSRPTSSSLAEAKGNRPRRRRVRLDARHLHD